MSLETFGDTELSQHSAVSHRVTVCHIYFIHGWVKKGFLDLRRTALLSAEGKKTQSKISKVDRWAVSDLFRLKHLGLKIFLESINHFYM
jgi:hypothetical protein